MALPELEYISLPEAAIKFSTSIEHVRGLIQSGNLTAYVALTQPRRYAKILDPVWNCGSLEYCQSIVIYKSGKYIEGGEVVYLAGRSDEYVLVKREELSALEQRLGDIKGSDLNKPDLKAVTTVLDENFRIKTKKVSTKRNDALGKIILSYLEEYRSTNNCDPQYIQVFTHLKKLGKDQKCKIIQDVEDGKVEWRNEKGKDKSTSTKQVQNRLTRLKTL